jgi:hypothetical protein
MPYLCIVDKEGRSAERQMPFLPGVNYSIHFINLDLNEKQLWGRYAPS